MYASYLVDQKVCQALKDVVDSDVAGWGETHSRATKDMTEQLPKPQPQTPQKTLLALRVLILGIVNNL
ncbi:hypothetical protein FPSE_10639 [Fusarium pseudograminearum CS3096]|uniref:Uncharacterized protein n=1 Tax=Fusarium pseudograminearum (strain CS3096) TaxID=1028729 RepID=K3V7J9_FUSPC|nr:hypothetical protein FPSE_10639 [Fusarium pseudograminearum CS3096]EKJ69174.1 hypothetical protein FPSE_10639 [Fusarium pseudograminearum CS3096]